MTAIQKLIQEYGNPLEWDAATRAATLLCMSVAVHTQYIVWALYQFSDWSPEVNKQYVNTTLFDTHATYIGAIWGLSVTLLILALILRKRFPNNIIYEYIATFYYSITLVYFSYFIGSMNLATGVVLAGAPVVGFILFNVRAVLFAFGASLVGQGVISYATTTGQLPYAPLIQNFQEANGALSSFWMETMYFFAAPHLIVLLVLAYQVLTQWRRREHEIRVLSLTDSLTQLSNRRSILTSLNHEQERSSRFGPSFSLLLIDLDHFKKVNDNWGHPAGDKVLVEASNALKAGVRKIDHVGRYGGEEFLVILPGTNLEGAYQLAERCRKSLEALEIDLGNGDTIKITGSMGLFCNEKDQSVSTDNMLHNADEALYKAKDSGRNCVVRG